METLAEAYPRALAKEEIAAKAGYEANGAVLTMRRAGCRRWSLCTGETVDCCEVGDVALEHFDRHRPAVPFGT